jgi:hypothetical protein
VGVSPRSPAGVHTLVEGLNTHSNVAHLTFVSASIGDPRRGGIALTQDVWVGRPFFRGRDLGRIGVATVGVVVVRGAPEPWPNQGRPDEDS